MSFSRGGLDDYVQNIHRSHATNVSISDPSTSRPKRIRKRKRFFIEESESIVRPKRVRRKRLQPILTDAEIEQQFGERLSPTIIKAEQNEETPPIAMPMEPMIPQTPMERAREKLINALKRKWASERERELMK